MDKTQSTRIADDFHQKLMKALSYIEHFGLTEGVDQLIAMNFIGLDAGYAKALFEHFHVFDSTRSFQDLTKTDFLHLDFPYSQQGACYYNSALNSFNSGLDNLWVVEGWAQSIIPTMHAWNTPARPLGSLPDSWPESPSEYSPSLLVLDSTWGNLKSLADSRQEPEASPVKKISDSYPANYFGAVVRPEFLVKHMRQARKDSEYQSILSSKILYTYGRKPLDPSKVFLHPREWSNGAGT